MIDVSSLYKYRVTYNDTTHEYEAELVLAPDVTEAVGPTPEAALAACYALVDAEILRRIIAGESIPVPDK
jgi:hypothetical protein